MTDTDRFAAIRAREAAAYPGPWITEHGDDLDLFVLAEDGAMTPIDFGYVGNRPEPNAEFVAAARDDVPFLLDKLVEFQQREQQYLELLIVTATDADRAIAERDRARATAVALEQEAAAAEEARQAWIRAVDEQLVKVKAERDQLAETVQRVCDLPLLNFSPIDDPGVAAAARAWSETVADSVALMEQLDGEVPDGD